MNRVIKAITIRVKRLYYKIGGNNIKGISLLRRFRNFNVDGTNNTIIIRGKMSKDVHVMIQGNNHRLIIGEGVVFNKGQIWFEDHDCEIYIGAGSTIGEAFLAVAESGSKISIGEDCMFSQGIHVVTTDSHSIIKQDSSERINPAKNVLIGDHVWIARGVTINKGVTIESNSVIAGNSVVTKSVPCNCIAAGVPAKIVKNNINWLRKRI